MSDEHGLTLLESEMTEIVRIVNDTLDERLRWWITNAEGIAEERAYAEALNNRITMSTKTETPQGVGTEDLLAEVVRLRAENIRLIEDRARFPDRPDDIGRIIGAHVENLKAAAAHNEDAWRWACTRETVLRNEIKRTLTENAHLADGENCTLARLKKLVPEWESEFLANNQDVERRGQ